MFYPRHNAIFIFHPLKIFKTCIHHSTMTTSIQDPNKRYLTWHQLFSFQLLEELKCFLTKPINSQPNYQRSPRNHIFVLHLIKYFMCLSYAPTLCIKVQKGIINMQVYTQTNLQYINMGPPTQCQSSKLSTSRQQTYHSEPIWLDTLQTHFPEKCKSLTGHPIKSKPINHRIPSHKISINH
ncbi:hypothetical protein ACB098_01G268600 [Castanea mollissima]